MFHRPVWTAKPCKHWCWLVLSELPPHLVCPKHVPRTVPKSWKNWVLSKMLFDHPGGSFSIWSPFPFFLTFSFSDSHLVYSFWKPGSSLAPHFETLPCALFIICHVQPPQNLWAFGNWLSHFLISFLIVWFCFLGRLVNLTFLSYTCYHSSSLPTPHVLL